MRALIDYRPALRERSGVGEYAHELVRALVAAARPCGTEGPLELTLFSSSWKDRFVPSPELDGTTAIDRRVPVSLLNFAWHRLNWPPIETLTAERFDVTHSMHPLLLPSSEAAQVVTIHDLNFLTHPERTGAEIRRDYARLARSHAHRADRIIVVSESTAREVERHLDVSTERISVCPPGRPPWTPRHGMPPNGYVLFLGTLESRKNIGGLLDAYEQLAARRRDLPALVLAGKATGQSGPWLERLARAPLAGLVRYIGYVHPANRRELYEGARLLVQPSFEEGFGIPVLEAMALGVPVVASDRGALPEVVGEAGLLVDPEETEQLAGAIERMIDDEACALSSAAKGVLRAEQFSWERTAARVYHAYQQAIEHRQCASA